MLSTVAGPVPAAQQRKRLPHLPALDGLRGLALIAILLTHGGVDTVKGGHLALTAFFTLSGFLITSLLLVERHQTGTVDLRQFWTRRARRLVPALLLCFPLVALVVLLSPERPTSGLVLDAVAAATWVANWRFIFAEQTYADLFALPSPFQHFWSLAVEEQFYLFFPLVLLAVLGVGAARARTGRLAVLLGLLVVASTVQAARLHAEHGPLGHAYYGTDARLAEILVGSMLALALVGPEGVRALSRWTRRAISAAGCAGLAGLVVLMLTLEKDADLTYRGGFLLAACCTGAVVAACLQPTSPVTRLLAWRPLVWLGVLSYGVYLFHWPLFQLLSARYTGLDGVPLLALRVSLVLGLAWLSYTLLERPVRNGGLPARPAIGGWATGAVAGVVIVAAASTAVTLPTTSALVQDPTQAAGSRALTDVDPTEGVSEVLAPPPPAEPLAAAPPAEAPAPAPAPARTTAPPVSSAPAAPGTGPKPSPSGHIPAASLKVVPPPAAPPANDPRPVEQTPPAALAPEHKDPVPNLPPRRAGALRVAVVGDSISANLGTGLQRWAANRPDLQVVVFSMGGCPLARGGERRVTPGNDFEIDPECAWWGQPNSRRQVRFNEYQPHLVLLDAGIDEVFDRKLDSWDDWRSPGDPQFDDWLVAEYTQAVRQWTAGGAKVLLGDTPCSDWNRFEPFREMQNGDARVKAVNKAYLRITGVERLGLDARVCPGGRYSHDVEGVRDGRFDGFHFTPEAQDALARNWLGPIVMQTGAGLAVD